MKKLMLLCIFVLLTLATSQAISFKRNKYEYYRLEDVYLNAKIKPYFNLIKNVDYLIYRLDEHKITHREIREIFDAGIPFKKKGRAYHFKIDIIIKRSDKIRKLLNHKDHVVLKNNKDRIKFISFIIDIIEKVCPSEPKKQEPVYDEELLIKQILKVETNEKTNPHSDCCIIFRNKCSRN